MQALRQKGWGVVRVIDLYPEKTQDPILFQRAAEDDRVFVTNDRPAEAIAIRWLIEGRRFRGMVAWPQQDYETRSIGDLVQGFEALAHEGEPLRLSDPLSQSPLTVDSLSASAGAPRRGP